MGKATGFMDYDRRDAECESPKERIKHFREFHTPHVKEEQEIQGARCMACGVPFCQAGQMIAGWQAAVLCIIWCRSGMTDLSRQLGRGILPAEKDKQFSGIYFQGMPGTL